MVEYAVEVKVEKVLTAVDMSDKGGSTTELPADGTVHIADIALEAVDY